MGQPHLQEREPTLLGLIRRSGLAGTLLWLWPVVLLTVSRERDLEDFDVVDAGVYVQAAFVVLCGVLALPQVMLFRRPPRRLLLSRPLVWVLLYTLLGALSATWSPQPIYSLYRAIECLVFLALISLAVQALQNRPGDLFRWVVAWSLFAGIIFALRTVELEKVKEDPVLGLHGFGSFIYGTLALVPFLLLRHRRMRVLMIAMCLISTSTKVYLSIVLGLLVHGIVSRRLRGAWTIVLGVLMAATVVAVGTQPFLQALFPGKTPQNIATGTGRTVIWEALLESGMERPWQGHGFVVGERVALTGGLEIYMAHNSFLAAFVGTGVIGVALLILFFLDLYRLSARPCRMPGWKPTLVATWAIVFFTAQVSTTIGTRLNEGWVSLIMLAAVVEVVAQPARERKVAPARASRAVEAAT